MLRLLTGVLTLGACIIVDYTVSQETGYYPDESLVLNPNLQNWTRFGENHYVPEWTMWSWWSECSRTCGSGIQKRTRICDGANHWTRRCKGRTNERQKCHLRRCPEPIDKIRHQSRRLPVWKQLEKYAYYFTHNCLKFKHAKRVCAKVLKRLTLLYAKGPTHRLWDIIRQFYIPRYCFNGTSVVKYNPQYELCCNGVHALPEEPVECCGGTVIKSTEKLCCDDTIYESVNTTYCCGNTPYDPQERMCCSGKIVYFSPSKNLVCCGVKVYNPSLSGCCGGEIYHDLNTTECCGYTTYQKGCFACDSNQLRPVFNETTEMCCDGTITNKTSTDLIKCCQGELHGSIYCKGVQESEDETSILEKSQTLDKSMVIKDNKSVYIVVTCLATAGLCISVLCLVIKIRKRRKRRHTSHLLQDVCSTAALIEDRNNARFSRSDLIRETNVDRPSHGKSVAQKLTKNQSVNRVNIARIQYLDSGTQTCPEKASNYRNIFGRPFDHKFILSEAHASVQMPMSDVLLTMPLSALSEQDVEVHCCTFSSVSAMRKKFGYSEGRRIASPVVEYLFTEIPKLAEHALIKMPYIGPSYHLEVWKFQSDEGQNPVVTSEKVHEQVEDNKEIDCFYIIEDRFVYIYTKQLSGFYCTNTRKHPLRLQAFLFGSFKKFTEPLNFEVRILLYITDSIHNVTDYRETLFAHESAEGRTLKKITHLELPENLKATDKIVASLHPFALTQWTHKVIPGSAKTFSDKEQVFQINQITEMCEECSYCHLPERNVPFHIEWLLTNTEGVIPYNKFQCVIDVDIHHEEDGTKTKNTLLIDELDMTDGDRLSEQRDDYERHLLSVRRFLSDLTEEEQEKILATLSATVEFSASTIEEFVDSLRRKYRPRMILKMIASALQSNNMLSDLDVMIAFNYLPVDVVSTDTIPVSSEHDFLVCKERKI